MVCNKAAQKSQDMGHNNIIKLEIIGQQPLPESKDGFKIMRFFPKDQKGDYSIHHNMDSINTIYEYSLHKCDLRNGNALAIVPCFDAKYVKHLQIGGNIIIDEDICKIKDSMEAK